MAEDGGVRGALKLVGEVAFPLVFFFCFFSLLTISLATDYVIFLIV